MATEVAGEILDQTFQERLQWIDNQRKKGNDQVQMNNFDKALDEYMKCLCALDFKSCSGQKPTEEQISMADRGVKIPVLNNMALSLQKLGKLERALSMCDQVLQIEEFNSKATSRKLSYLLEAG